MAGIRAILKQVVKGSFFLYRLSSSALWGSCCRFYPSCSQYAEKAIEIHGLGKGFLLTLKRLLKCHPWHTGGCDPVPEKTASSRQTREREISERI